MLRSKVNSLGHRIVYVTLFNSLCVSVFIHKTD